MARYEVWDPKGIIELVSFETEEKAAKYKTKMEKKYDHPFRMNKIFENSDEKDVVPKNYSPVVLVAVAGDIITSENGFLMHSDLTGKTYRVKKAQILESGGYLAVEKEEIISNGS